MAEVVHTYDRLRKEFGRPVEFQDAEPEVLIDIFPKQELKDSYVPLDPYEVEHQCAPELAEGWSNTESRTLVPRGILHFEGGWPLGVDPTEIESKIKYCRKAERDESYVEACKRLIEPVEEVLMQNNAIDIYETYFSDTVTNTVANLSATISGSTVPSGPTNGGGSTQDTSGEPAQDLFDDVAPATARARSVLTDSTRPRRPAVHLSWQGEKRLAVAYSSGRSYSIGTSLGYQASSTEALLFDLNNPNFAEMALGGTGSVSCIQFNPKDVHLIAGGSQTGVVQIWDSRKPPAPVAESNVEYSHRGEVTDLRWLMAKSGEVLTTSTDGHVMLWDIKKMDKPIEGETVEIKCRPNDVGPRGILGGLCIDYDPLVGGPSKYMVGTEHGITFSCNRRGKSANEKIIAAYSGHHGPVYSVMRNPMFPKHFLTVGDWRMNIWVEDLRLPIITTPYADAYLTSGTWHPIRPGVMMCTRSDGQVDIWDLLYKHTVPACRVRVSDSPVTSIRTQADGRMAAVAGVDGTVTLLELSDSLVELQRDEKALIGATFDRESARDKALAQRAKELRVRGRRKMSNGAAPKNEAAVDDVALGELAEHYLQAVKAAEDEQLRVEKERRELREQRLAVIDAEVAHTGNGNAAARN